MFLVASGECASREALRDDPAFWRRIRRYNLPVQLALAAAEQVHPHLADASQAALVSLAPCVGGSRALSDWIARIGASACDGKLGELRVNPTHTLHAIDNLALSDLALALGNRGYGLGLGSAPGQAWVALELILERDEAEALILAGDHAGLQDLEHGCGVALGFAREAGPCADGRTLRLLRVERLGDGKPAERALCTGWVGLLQALRSAPLGHFVYAVPPADGDGLDAIRVHWEVA